MARREEREATESAAADMLRRSARVLRTLEEACVRARAAPSPHRSKLQDGRPEKSKVGRA